MRKNSKKTLDKNHQMSQAGAKDAKPPLAGMAQSLICHSGMLLGSRG